MPLFYIACLARQCINSSRRLTAIQPPQIRTPPPHPRHGLRTTTHPRPFSTTPSLLARKKSGPKRDKRILLIRYHLLHPLTPRPLRFSRTRSLRHWTIHRAWQLYRSKARAARALELERQFNSMREACETLRLLGEDGLAVRMAVGRAVPPIGARDPEFVRIGGGEKAKDGEGAAGAGAAEGEYLDVRAAAEQQQRVGRLYRTAMLKTGVWDAVPIEYARAQTETPPRNGWDHGWTR